MHERSDSPVAPSALPLREVLLVLAALALVVATAWLYLAFRATSGHGGMEMATMMEAEPRGVVHFGLLFVMWAVMMVAMMVLTATPVILLYTAFVRRLPSVRKAVAQTAAFVAAYIWTRTASDAKQTVPADDTGRRFAEPARRPSHPLLQGGLTRWRTFQTGG